MDRAPSQTISGAMIDALAGRRVTAALFTSYEFDPSFFEQEILPTLIDVALSHAPRVRLAQLEEALRSMRHRLAVFYDRRGLLAGETGSRRLDLDCQCIGGSGGLFHPKVSMILVDNPPDADGAPCTPSLVVMVGSCNLTRAGWWRNLEVAHLEELRLDSPSELGAPLLHLLSTIERRRIGNGTCESLEAIRSFLRKVPSRSRRSAGGRVLTQLYVSGQESVPDFLARATGNALRGMHLEVLSSSFDEGGLQPLAALQERFDLESTRLHLPMLVPGTASISESTMHATDTLHNTAWSTLPRAVLAGSRAEGTHARFMHAKVYRFFSIHPKREIMFVGSVNLTTAAHHGRQNTECGILIEVETPRRPQPWLEAIKGKIAVHDATSDGVGLPVSPLMLAYDWSTASCQAYWDAATAMPAVALTRGGLDVGALEPMPARQWLTLPGELSSAIAEHLRAGSMFTAAMDGGDQGVLLVQESGMELKPSLMMHLSPLEILKLWTMLTPEERAEFLQLHGRDFSAWGLEEDATQAVDDVDVPTLFDRFAGMFTAFDALERRVHAALEAGKDREAIALLFGSKHDSLGHVLAKLDQRGAIGVQSPPVLERSPSVKPMVDPVLAYLMLLCSQSVLDGVKSRHLEFVERHVNRVDGLQQQIKSHAARHELMADAARRNEPLDGFLEWFERAFLTRAAPAERAQ